MAIPAAANQKYLVTFKATAFNQVILNTFVYNLTVPGTVGTVDIACDTLKAKLDEPNALFERWQNALPPNVTIDEVRVQCIWPQRVAAISYPFVGTGAFIDEADTANQAAVITRRGELANRRNVGSLHMLAPSGVGSIQSGVIQAAYRSALDSLATQVKTQYTEVVFGTTWTPVLFSKSQPSLLTPIVSTTVQNSARVMRRRTVGLGI